MVSTGINQVKIGEHVYSYTVLSPVEALRFGTEALKVLGPGMAKLATGSLKTGDDVGSLVTSIAPALENLETEKLERLLKTVFAHTFTPTNENLGDEAAFNDWFQKNPHEMFQVGFQILYLLSKDFFPKLSGTTQP